MVGLLCMIGGETDKSEEFVNTIEVFTYFFTKC